MIQKIKPLGPCNIQYRKHRNQLIPFEFNIRFSGTTPIRSCLGFNDVDMAIRHFVLQKPLKSPKIKKAVAFRYWNEIIVAGENFKRIEGQGSFNGNKKRIRVLNAI